MEQKRANAPITSVVYVFEQSGYSYKPKEFKIVTNVQTMQNLPYSYRVY